MPDQITTKQHRYVFIPNDYRLPAVLGWLMPNGSFEPDSPVPANTDGILVSVRAKAPRS